MSDVVKHPIMMAGGALAPIRPQTLDDVMRLAKIAVFSGLLKPQKLKKAWGTNQDDDKASEETEDQTQARGVMIILQGLEVGIPPMQALQLMALINGRIVLHSEGVPGILWAKGFKLKQWIDGEGDKRVASAEITRPTGEVITRTYSVENAKKAGLWSPNAKVTKKGKTGSYEVANDSPWYRYDFRMLAARALGFAAKDGASDATRGLMIREEAEDIERMRDITPAVPKKSSALAKRDGTTEKFNGLLAQIGATTTKEAVDAILAEPETMKVYETLPPRWQSLIDDEIARVIGDDETVSEDDPPLADAEAYLDRLRELRDECNSIGELMDLSVQEQSMIARLSEADQTKAAEIQSEEGEGQ